MLTKKKIILANVNKNRAFVGRTTWITKCVYKTCLSQMPSLPAVYIMLHVGKIQSQNASAHSFKSELYLFYVPYNIFNFVFSCILLWMVWNARATVVILFVYHLVASQRPRPQQLSKQTKYYQWLEISHSKC